MFFYACIITKKIIGKVVIILPLNDPVFSFHLRDIQIRDVESVVFPYSFPDLIIGCQAFRAGQIQFIHFDRYFDVMFHLRKFGQKYNCILA